MMSVNSLSPVSRYSSVAAQYHSSVRLKSPYSPVVTAGSVSLLLLVEHAGIALGPAVGGHGGAGCLVGKRRVVLVALEDAGSLSHNGCKVERGGRALLYHVALLLAVRRHDEALEVGRGQLVVDTAVVGILHGEHPAQVVHHLVEHVGRLVLALRDVDAEAVVIATVLLVAAEHDADGEGRVDDVLVVVASVVPAARRRDDAAGGTA